MTPPAVMIAVCAAVAQERREVPQPPHAPLYPSAVVTLALV
jgi:hypothetical protein